MTLHLGRELAVGSLGNGAQRIVERARVQETAFGASFGGGGGSGASAGTSIGGTAPPGLIEGVLEGFLPPSPVLKRRIYREMFHNDPVVGSGIDLLSSFPFSTFQLTGVNDENRLRKYWSAIDMIDIRTLLPALSVNYLVFGSFIGCLNWDERGKIYNALIPQNLDFCNIQPVGITGVDPVVTVQLPKELKALLDGKLNGAGAKNKQAAQQLTENIQRIPDELLRKLKSNEGITLDSNSLIYIARGGMLEDHEGLSILSRCLPIWLMEKALIRGTLDQVWKRQRAILLATLGGEDWEPTPADYNGVNDILLQADHDPTGAIVTLRQGISVQEIRRGDDFWRYDTFFDFSSNAKLSAMGISQSFVTGDATIGAMEGAVNVTLQHFKTYRDMLTKVIFYDKIFPMIAIKNGYLRREKQVVIGDLANASYEQAMQYVRDQDWHDPIRYNPIMREFYAELSAQRGSQTAQNTDMTKYSMPKVVWTDTLDANTTEKMADALKAAEEHGIPIPYRTFVAACGATVEDWIEQRDSDVKLAAFFKSYRDQRAQFDPQQSQDPNDTGGDGGGMSMASIREGAFNDGVQFANAQRDNGYNDLANDRVDDQLAQLFGYGGVRRGPGILGREGSDFGQPRRETHRGTTGILSRAGQDAVNDKLRKQIVGATYEARQHAAWHAAEAAPEPSRTQHRAFPLSRKHYEG